MPNRDPDRIREIIIQVVEMPLRYDDGFVDFAKLMKAGDGYQLYLMEDAGLIQGDSCKEGFFFVTIEGQDFYDAVKSDEIWASTKAAVVEHGGSVAIDVMKRIALGFLKTKLEKHTGYQLD